MICARTKKENFPCAGLMIASGLRFVQEVLYQNGVQMQISPSRHFRIGES